jgi:hypothetical protein
MGGLIDLQYNCTSVISNVIFCSSKHKDNFVVLYKICCCRGSNKVTSE